MHVNIAIKVYYRTNQNNSDKRDQDENSSLIFVGFSKCSTYMYLIYLQYSSLVITHGSAIPKPNYSSIKVLTLADPHRTEG